MRESVIGLLLLAWGIGAQSTCNSSRSASASSTCSSVGSTVCGEYYSSSSFPNVVTFSADSAMGSVDLYLPASTQLGCPRLARIYFCLALMPYCSLEGAAVSVMGPCQSFCELVSNLQCLAGAQTKALDRQTNCLFSSCSRFPTQGCIDHNHTLVLQALAATSPPPPSEPDTTITIPSDSTGSIIDPSPPPSCPLPNNTFFSDSSKSFAVGWVSFWSVLCFISTMLTILTFLLETSRFQYPWRPVVYLALVFNVHSVAYFLSLALGRELITCPGGQFVENQSSWSWSHTPCILVFVVLYYTVMTAFIWWLVLCVCWFLVAALKWSHEAVGKLSPIFHVAAWILPLLMTIALLAARAMGADELTATCFVVSNGTTSSFLALLIGVILPLIILITVGMVFLLLGFISILRVRALMQKGGKQHEQQSLEKLLIRIGVFVSVYIIPASILIGCYVYELVSRPSWQPLSVSCSDCARPNSAVFMVRVFMFLLIGVLTGVWIWSHKTLRSWQQCPTKFRACCNPQAEEDDADIEMPTPNVLAAENILSDQKMPSYSYPDSGLESI